MPSPSAVVYTSISRKLSAISYLAYLGLQSRWKVHGIFFAVVFGEATAAAAAAAASDLEAAGPAQIKTDEAGLAAIRLSRRLATLPYFQFVAS